MNKEKKEKYIALFENELSSCIDFWLRNGIDYKRGGVYTCLDREGKIYSTDKSVWMQGRCGWIFAYLCNTYCIQEKWLEASKNCIDFLDQYCIDKTDSRMYFTVTENGLPLRKRRYFFSEAFSVIAHAEYALASGDIKALDNATAYYDFIYNIYKDRNNDPYKITPKTIAETRAFRSLAEPMILLNVNSILRTCDSKNKEKYNVRAKEYSQDIIKYFYKEDKKILLENVGLHGEFMDFCSEGRLINPGHDIEAAWFLLEEAIYRNDKELASVAEEIFNNAVSVGYDSEYGGLLYFVDAYGYPPQQYEHDMKLWWVHNEAIIASLMFYKYTKDEKYLKLFEDFTKYAFSVFADKQYGEWYGYLRRDGKPTEPPCKGSIYKGPFHLPRMLIKVDTMLKTL